MNTCQAAGIEPLIAMGREVHHPSLSERFAEAPPAPENPTPVEAMAHRLQTPEGKKLYAQHKCIPEPVFGIVKSVLGFRQFLLRGLDKVKGEWSLVTMAWNLKRMFALKTACGSSKVPCAKAVWPNAIYDVTHRTVMLIAKLQSDRLLETQNAVTGFRLAGP